VRWLLVAVVCVFGALTFAGARAERASAECAFAPGQNPHTYEAPQNRLAYLVGAQLAAYNMIAPDDTFFGTPYLEQGPRGARTTTEPYIPPRLLQAIGWIESALAQATYTVPWGATGPVLQSFDCGHGIMQITSGMRDPADGGWPSREQALVATHYLYNIARGAAILVQKWNAAPELRPVVGNGDPRIVEDWYYAVWSYNGFAFVNHPFYPGYDLARPGFSCGPLGDGYGHSYGDYPYQEIVFGCMARPPSVGGAQLWEPLPVSLPDLTDDRWRLPLSLNDPDTWTPCIVSSDCAGMDMPSPEPTHQDDTPRPADGAFTFLHGSPSLQLSRTSVSGPESQVVLSNSGTGLVAWRARRLESWIQVDKQAGVALGATVPCTPGAPCERSPTLTITVDTAAAPPGAIGTVTVEGLNTGQRYEIEVRPYACPDVDSDGGVAIDDVLLVLAHLGNVEGSPTWDPTRDIDGDGAIALRDVMITLARFGELC
jgi:hypothetical protein